MKKKTVVFIHGMTLGAWYWKELIKIFKKKGYHCVVLNLPYHNSQNNLSKNQLKIFGGIGFNEYLEYIKSKIKRFRKPILVGHSMGGALAELVASKGLAGAVIAINPAALPPINVFVPPAIRIFLFKLLMNGFFNRPFHITFQEAKRIFFSKIDKKTAMKYYAQMGYESGKVLYELAINWVKKKSLLRINYANFRTPILLIGCKKDTVVPYYQVRKQYRLYNSTIASYIEYPNFTHWVIGEPGWERMAKFILEWLKEVEKDKNRKK